MDSTRRGPSEKGAGERLAHPAKRDLNFHLPDMKNGSGIRRARPGSFSLRREPGQTSSRILKHSAQRWRRGRWLSGANSKATLATCRELGPHAPSTSSNAASASTKESLDQYAESSMVRSSPGWTRRAQTIFRFPGIRIKPSFRAAGAIHVGTQATSAQKHAVHELFPRPSEQTEENH